MKLVQNLTKLIDPDLDLFPDIGYLDYISAKFANFIFEILRKTINLYLQRLGVIFDLYNSSSVCCICQLNLL